MEYPCMSTFFSISIRFRAFMSTERSERDAALDGNDGTEHLAKRKNWLLVYEPL